MNYLCNNYGLYTISTGVSISFIMECYENGLISKENMDGLELKNRETMKRSFKQFIKLLSERNLEIF